MVLWVGGFASLGGNQGIKLPKVTDGSILLNYRQGVQNTTAFAFSPMGGLYAFGLADGTLGLASDPYSESAAPGISVQPQSRVVSWKTDVRFRVTATGVTPFYRERWFGGRVRGVRRGRRTRHAGRARYPDRTERNCGAAGFWTKLGSA